MPRTWVGGVAVGALVIPANAVYQLLELLFVARLLALAQR